MISISLELKLDMKVRRMNRLKDWTLQLPMKILYAEI